MARRPFVAGNWKMNLGPEAARTLALELRSQLVDRGDLDVAVFPTPISVHAVASALLGSGIEVGVQDVHPAASGAYTGATSPQMARKIGCTRALVGHSERRHLFGETDEQVHTKVLSCLEHGLLPIVCVGETLEQRDAGQAISVVEHQLSVALHGLASDQIPALTIAYEPVWAIGTGRTASPDQAQEIHAALRASLAAKHPPYVADQTRILYGGSVKPANASTLLGCPDIDGALVGGASLEAASFRAIVDAA